MFHLFLVVPGCFPDEEISVVLEKADDLAAGKDAVEPGSKEENT